MCTEENEYLDIITSVEAPRNLILLSETEFCKGIELWRNGVTAGFGDGKTSNSKSNFFKIL